MHIESTVEILRCKAPFKSLYIYCNSENKPSRGLFQYVTFVLNAGKLPDIRHGFAFIDVHYASYVTTEAHGNICFHICLDHL